MYDWMDGRVGEWLSAKPGVMIEKKLVLTKQNKIKNWSRPVS